MPPTANGRIDVALHPGGFFFSDLRVRICTLPGVCVAITMWQAQMRIGGMGYFILHEAERRIHDGRYPQGADKMLQRFLQQIHVYRTQPADYQVKLLGAGRIFDEIAPVRAGESSPGRVETWRRLLQEHGFGIHREHPLGDGDRKLSFDLASGEVLISHQHKAGEGRLRQAL